MQTKANSGYSSQGCRQMETLASRQPPLYRTAMDKCGALSHTVTYASLLHDNNISVFSESLFLFCDYRPAQKSKHWFIVSVVP